MICINPMAFKIVYNFGLSESSRVKVFYRYLFEQAITPSSLYDLPSLFLVYKLNMFLIPG